MPDPWCPHAIRDPGKGAGYAVGSNDMRLVVMHCTAGTNSYSLVKNGSAAAPSTLAQFLVPKVGQPWQFTEVDAKCYDSPPNDDGPGIEIERMSAGTPTRPGLSGWEELTVDQTYYLGLIVDWLYTEWGVPQVLYDGPRTHGIGVPGFHGYANHGDVDNQRSDGITREEWDAILAVGSMPDLGPLVQQQRRRRTSDMVIVFSYDTGQCWLLVGNVRIRDFVGPPGAFGVPQDAIDFSNGDINIRQMHAIEMKLLDDVSKKLLA